MSVAVLFGLCSAGLYGTADFVSHFANKRSGVLRTMLYAQIALAAGLSAGLLFVHHGLPSGVSEWAILVISDACILVGTACLYRGLAIGNLAIVPPVAACYGAVAALLAIMGGEKVGVLPCMGLVLAVAGGVVTAIPSETVETDVPRQTSGTLLAAAAALLYGGGFWMQGRFSVPVFGSYVPVWSYYLLGSLALAAFAIATGADRSLPSRREMLPMFGTALLAIGGYGMLAAGQATGEIAVVTGLGSIASAVTVLLARVILKQSVTPRGWLGLASVVTGLVVLHSA